MLQDLLESNGQRNDDECYGERYKPCRIEKIHTVLLVADMKHLEDTHAGRYPLKNCSILGNENQCWNEAG